MLNGLIGRITPVAMLKQSLDASSVRVRSVAQRVANASAPGSADFASALERSQQGGQGQEPIDLETEMVALADEQLRYSASARLLQKVYAQVRASIRER